MSPRKVLQDMVPSRKKSPLKEVVPVHIHRHTEKEPVIETTHVTHIPQARPVILERPLPPKRKMTRHPFFIIGTIIVCIAAILVAVSFVYAKATVTVVPKRETIAVNNAFVACKDTACPTTASTKSPALSYEVIQIPATDLYQMAPAIDGPLVQTNATGIVVLYNNYSTTPQTIAVGTRLSNTAGLIYKTTKAVTIPGFKKTGSKATYGSVSVPVVASAPGPNYNIAPTDLTGDFKIVAYNNTDKYDTIYGRLDPTNSIAGGFSGHTKVVASTTLAQTYTTLKQKLAAQLLANSTPLIPDGYIMYNNAYSISYTPIVAAATTSTATTVNVGIRGTFYGIMFKKDDLVKAAALAAKSTENLDIAYPGDAFTASGLDALAFTTTSTISDPSKPLAFTLKGSIGITGTFPVDDIITQLEGKNLAQSNDIFAKYSTIATAHAIITPFWRHSFPDSPKKISIIIQ